LSENIKVPVTKKFNKNNENRKGLSGWRENLNNTIKE